MQLVRPAGKARLNPEIIGATAGMRGKQVPTAAKGLLSRFCYAILIFRRKHLLIIQYLLATKTTAMRFLLLLVCQCGIQFSIAAADQDGYILKTTGDTVWGKVDVQMKKILFGKKEIDLADMEQKISFTENGGKSQWMKAGDIGGYGFKFDDMWYHFVVLDWPKNTWKKSQNAFERKVKDLRLFIHRFHDGAVPLYKDYFKVTTTTIGSAGSSKSERLTTELYILTADLGFVEVAPSGLGANKKLKEFLMKYLSLEEDFMKTVDDKAKFSDAEEVLIAYNDWKRRN